jgi:uncharacterized membrane protein
MPKFSIMISIIVLIVCLFLLFNKLFTPQPLQITLQTGQEISTSTSEFFSFPETILLIISAFLVGMASTYLYFNSDKVKLINESNKNKFDKHSYDLLIPLLKNDEKQVVHVLINSNGEILQNKLVEKLGHSKVKTTRILFRLEKKKLITKHRFGLTNKVFLIKPENKKDNVE